MKSVRSVSVPSSSAAMALKQVMISLNLSSGSKLLFGSMRTEKSPFMMVRAASVICLTGRSTVIFRRMASMTVHTRLRNTTLPKVYLAAAPRSSSVSFSPMVHSRMVTKSIMQQVRMAAASRKNTT